MSVKRDIAEIILIQIKNPHIAMWVLDVTLNYF